MDASEKLISLRLERNALGGLIKHPKVFGEIENFITPEVFADSDNVHSTIYSVIRSILSSGKTEQLDKVVVAQEIKNLGISFKSDLNIFDYVNSISFSPPTQKATVDSFKQLLKLKVCRDLFYQSDKVKKYIVDNISEPMDKIIENVDMLNSEKVLSFRSSFDEIPDLFCDLDAFIHNVAANPIDPTQFMYGPFESVNRLYGSLHRPGNITLVGARSGAGKTASSMFYNVFVADKYNIPLLHLDNGEMTDDEIRFRAACMLCKGKISIHQLEYGGWTKSEKDAKILKEALEKAKKVKFYYKNIAGMQPIEIISFIRRFGLNKVGRDNLFIVNYDYLKPFDTSDYNSPEWKVMGHFIQDIKTFITSEMKIPIWTSLQLNKYGITTGRKATEVIDNENAFSISDKILQQTSHSILMRPKLSDEIAVQGHEFGNLVWKFVKTRHLGEDWKSALEWVEVGGKKYERNYVNLLGDSFWFEDKGDLKSMMSKLKDKYELEEQKNGEALLE